MAGFGGQGLRIVENVQMSKISHNENKINVANEKSGTPDFQGWIL